MNATDHHQGELRLAWPLNAVFWIMISIPALSGYPVNKIQSELVTGISWGWIAYFLVVHLFSYAMLGSRLYGNIVAAAVLITLPVVFAGAAFSRLFIFAGLTTKAAAAHGSHYTGLCLTMLTVVPLALSLATILPFERLEQRLLTQTNGIGGLGKKTLMTLRVFQHIAFFVLPSTLEILREERLAQRWRAQWENDKGALLNVFLMDCTHLAVEIICASLQYIPLWAHEIARLPDKPAPKKA